jgi:hypothetical protein
VRTAASRPWRSPLLPAAVADAAEVARSIGFPEGLVRAVLEHEVTRGHVVRVGQGFAPSPELVAEYGAGFRELPAVALTLDGRA